MGAEGKKGIAKRPLSSSVFVSECGQTPLKNSHGGEFQTLGERSALYLQVTEDAALARHGAPFVTGLAANGQRILVPHTHTHRGPLRSALKLQQPVERFISGWGVGGAREVKVLAERRRKSRATTDTPSGSAPPVSHRWGMRPGHAGPFSSCRLWRRRM